MIVDSAVWVDLFTRKRGRAWPVLRRALADRARVFAVPAIVQEVVQGARDAQELAVLKAGMARVPVLEAESGIALALAAAELYARCRWGGVTIRSPIDCLIAATAIEHGEPLLTEDRDFPAIRSIAPRLKLIDVPTA
ncbi:MAG: PIN domain-containing protein [Burkholderiales bacterium]|nr:PIN domain-containing protein [Burkholderiales bacterium]